MSTTTAKRPLAQALADAEAFRALFPSSCYVRWEIAGSVRRGRPEVGDIEHVVQPAWRQLPRQVDLFETREEWTNTLWLRLDELVKTGTVTQHLYRTQTGEAPRWGERYRGVDYRGFTHEIFTSGQDNWGAILAIRTGPAHMSRELVTRLSASGRYRMRDGEVHDLAQWNCRCGHAVDNRDLVLRDEWPTLCSRCLARTLIPVPVPVRDEVDFFTLCGRQWIRPEARDEPPPRPTPGQGPAGAQRALWMVPGGSRSSPRT